MIMDPDIAILIYTSILYVSTVAITVELSPVASYSTDSPVHQFSLASWIETD